METLLYVNGETIVPKIDPAYLKISSTSLLDFDQIWIGTQSQYDSILNKDEHTLYIII